MATVFLLVLRHGEVCSIVVARPFRLREESDVKRVRSRGRSAAHGPLVLRYLPNTLEPRQNRYTVIAGKRCGNAIQRNRQKRLVREALRGYHPHLRQGFDIAVICRGTVEELPSLAVAQDSLARILRRTPIAGEGCALPEPGTPIATGWKLVDAGSAPDTLSAPGTHEE